MGSGRRPSFATLRRRGAHGAFGARPQVFAPLRRFCPSLGFEGRPLRRTKALRPLPMRLGEDGPAGNGGSVFSSSRRRGAHGAFGARPQVFARRRVGSDPGSSLRGVGRVAQRTRFPVRFCRRFRIRASNPRGITALGRRTSPVASGRTFRRRGIEPVRPAPGTPAGLGSTRPEGHIAVVPARIDRWSRE